MDLILNTSDFNDPYSPVNTLIKALKTTIQLNDVIKSKLLNKENYFSHQQKRVINENVDLLDDNSMIINKAIQAIITLLSEIKNLKEWKLGENYSNSNDNLDSKNNTIIKNNFSNVINYDNNTNYLDSEILNRYDFNTKQQQINLNSPNCEYQDVININNNDINNNLNNFSHSEDDLKFLDRSIKTNQSNNYNCFKKGQLSERSLNENAQKYNYEYKLMEDRYFYDNHEAENKALSNHSNWNYNESSEKERQIENHKNNNRNREINMFRFNENNKNFNVDSSEKLFERSNKLKEIKVSGSINSVFKIP